MDAASTPSRHHKVGNKLAYMSCMVGRKLQNNVKLGISILRALPSSNIPITL
jgi:hypothetical protein